MKKLFALTLVLLAAAACADEAAVDARICLARYAAVACGMA